MRVRPLWECACTCPRSVEGTGPSPAAGLGLRLSSAPSKKKRQRRGFSLRGDSLTAAGGGVIVMTTRPAGGPRSLETRQPYSKVERTASLESLLRTSG